MTHGRPNCRLLIYCGTASVKANTATGISVLYGVTFANPYFWFALVACLALGVCLLASWPVQIQN